MEIEVKQTEPDLDRAIESGLDLAESQAPEGQRLSKLNFTTIDVLQSVDGERDYCYKFIPTYEAES